jgi:hypothetical protein
MRSIPGHGLQLNVLPKMADAGEKVDDTKFWTRLIRQPNLPIWTFQSFRIWLLPHEEGRREFRCATSAFFTGIGPFGMPFEIDAANRKAQLFRRLAASCRQRTAPPIIATVPTDVLVRMVSGRTKVHGLARLPPWHWKAERLSATVEA